MDNTSMEIQEESSHDNVDAPGSDGSESPDTSYNNAFPGREDEEKDPPSVPPHLHQTLLNSSIQPSDSLACPQNVILNHLYIRNRESTQSVIALGLTHRFRSKFVTVVLYKPVQRRGM
eukprot:TRINITY_DN33312_c0_g1_i1.p1 TRINITY_DN33312_c0_g1~~TRINITY_DN33312_c0_g1_i1.p1  ORF type:complete len:118 (-),score=24.60 TRINITY_DN33312_c0_g1_i1:66-419(-)